MRRASCRSLPSTCRPPMAATSRPSGFICSRCSISWTRASHFLGRDVQSRGIFRLKLGPGHGLGIAAEDDVGAAAGHVRGDGHGPFAAGLGDDFRLALVVLGVEHLVRHAALFEHPRDHFAALDGDRAHQDRPPGPLDAADLAAGNRLLLAGLAVLELDRVVRLAEDLAQQLVAFFRDDDVPLVHPLDFVGDGLVLLPLAAVDHVRMVDPLHLAIGGHRRSRRACRPSRTRWPRSWRCRSCRRSSCRA